MAAARSSFEENRAIVEITGIAAGRADPFPQTARVETVAQLTCATP
ncbi:MAG: hypothetical protein HY703_04430 [Gemmatimonadetes bacterium]|nr:hypothetical protein [Gemmatimonadota bacterium]